MQGQRQGLAQTGQQQQQQQQQQQSQQQQQQQQNAPVLSQFGSGSQTTLRLRLADEYRIDPPIPVSAALSAQPPAPRTGHPTSNGHRPALDMEQQLVEDSRAPTDVVAAYFNAISITSLQPEKVSQFIGMGFPPLHTALGNAWSANAKLSDSDAMDFATNMQDVMNQGFNAAVAAGALSFTNNDVVEAQELCLALPHGVGVF